MIFRNYHINQRRTNLTNSLRISNELSLCKSITLLIYDLLKKKQGYTIKKILSKTVKRMIEKYSVPPEYRFKIRNYVRKKLTSYNTNIYNVRI